MFPKLFSFDILFKPNKYRAMKSPCCRIIHDWSTNMASPPILPAIEPTIHRYKCNVCGTTFPDLSRHILFVEHEEDAPFIIGLYGQSKTTANYGYKNMKFPAKFLDIQSKLIRTNSSVSISLSHSKPELIYTPMSQIEANVDSSDASETDTFETTMPSGETFFPQPEDRAMFEELIRLLPEVVTELGKQDPIHAQRLKDMFILIREGSFPFDNISYLLFEGVIQWFRCKDIRSMSNSEQTKLFMATGRKLFGNCFVEFMRGPGFKYSDKSSNSLTLEDSHINFAVPSIPTLLNLNSDDIPARLDPGFLHQVVDSYIKNNPDALTIEHGVSGDFETAARSKEDRLSMVDLLGYEPEPTKAQKTIPPWSQPY